LATWREPSFQRDGRTAQMDAIAAQAGLGARPI